MRADLLLKLAARICQVAMRWDPTIVSVSLELRKVPVVTLPPCVVEVVAESSEIEEAVN